MFEGQNNTKKGGSADGSHDEKKISKHSKALTPTPINKKRWTKKEVKWQNTATCGTHPRVLLKINHNLIDFIAASSVLTARKLL